MKFGGVGPRKFILQTFVTFAIVSLIYNLFISLQRFPLFSPLPCMVPPSTCFEQFAALYEIIQQAFQMQTIFGLLLGAAISIVLILIIIQHQKQPHSPVSHYLIIGAIVGGFRGITAGVKVGGKAVASIVVGIVAVGLVGGILGGFSGGISGFLRSALIMIAAIGISSGIYIILLPIEWMLASAISSLITPPLILQRFSTIICNNCLRYTRALKAKYKDGTRYCERCRKEVEFTQDPGEVLVNFGNIPLILEGRVFMLSDPDFEQKTKFIEISQVYIDTRTCDRLLLEKFVTYIVNYPPENGLKSVEIFYKGKLDDLGDNLKNSLQNNFEHIEKIMSGET